MAHLDTAYRLGVATALQTFEKHAEPLVGEAEKFLPRLLERLTGSARETVPTRLRGAAEAAEKRLGGLSSVENMFDETPQWAGPPKPGEAPRNFSLESNPELAEQMRATRAQVEGDVDRSQANLQRHWGIPERDALNRKIEEARLMAATGAATALGGGIAGYGAASGRGQKTYYNGPTLKDIFGR
jgi:hypothetical protein